MVSQPLKNLGTIDEAKIEVTIASSSVEGPTARADPKEKLMESGKKEENDV